jgi:hypothetical protein
MSVKYSSLIWLTSRTRGTQRLVLLALADFCNDEGMCWPSIDSLAHYAAVSRRAVQENIRKIQQAGELEIVENAGPKGTHIYRILLGGAGDAPPKARGADSRAKGVQIPDVNLHPIQEHPSTEPSEGLDKVRPTPRVTPKKTRSLTALEEARVHLEHVFSEATGLKTPQQIHGPDLTAAQAKEAAVRWWRPLDEIYKQAGGNLQLAEQAIREAIEHHFDRRLDRSAPASIKSAALTFLTDGLSEESDGYKVGHA